MRRLAALACILALAVCAGMPVPSAGEALPTGEYTDFVILTTTDMHGKCWDTNLLTGADEKNNMLRVSTAVRQIRDEYGKENVILLDNGDLFQGTPVSQVQLALYAAGESDDPPAMALCLKEIGYDAMTLGNHEFNYPWEAMRGTYRWLEENGVAVLAANVVYDGSVPGQPAGGNAFTPYIVRTVTVNGHEHRIGILGLENTDITRWDLPVNFPGLRFAREDNKDWSAVYEASCWIPRMREEGCEFVIVCFHSGIGDTDTPLAIGVNTEDQGRWIGEETEGVSLLVLGHDHQAGYSNTFVTGPSGEQVLVVNGGAQDLTKSVYRFTEDEKGALRWEFLLSENLSPGDYEVDSGLEEKLRPYAALAEAEVDAPVGMIAGEWNSGREFYTSQTDSMDLVSAAMIAAGTAGMEKKYGASGLEALQEDTGADHLDVDMSVSSVTAGSGFSLSPGTVSMRDIYQLYRYSNTLLVVPMTGRQIRAAMEENAAERLTARVLRGQAHFYPTNDNFTNMLFGGVNFRYDLSRPAGERVVIDGFSNGRPFEEDRVYLVAVNNYLLGNEHCGLRGLAPEDALWVQADDGDGQNIQNSIEGYIRTRTGEKGAVTPEDFPWRWGIVYGEDPAALPPYEGKTAAVLADRPEDGKAYILYHEPSGCTLSARGDSGSLDGVPVPARGDTLADSLPEDALVFTAHVNGEGLVSFTLPDGRILSCARGGGVLLSDSPSEDGMDLWRLEEAPGCWYIVCAGSENSLALEYYSGRFTTFRLSESGAYLFNFYSPAE